MKLEEYFSKEELEKVKEKFTIFHDKVFLDDEIKNTDALLIVVYMISNKNKKSEVGYNECLELFCKLGRKNDTFSKALYELTKRGKSFLEVRGKGKKAVLSLNFSGIKRVKEVLSKDATKS